MTDPHDDPFLDLYTPLEPVDPDPAFARRLRARLERALPEQTRQSLPRGVVPVTATAPAPTTENTARPVSAALPYLAVADARAAIDWYVDVFGAELDGEPIVMPDGRIGHSELRLAGGAIYLSDAHPEIGVTAPRPGESNVSLMLAVDDADAVRQRAMAAGASGDRPPYDGYGSRNAWIVDPFGHRWGLHSPLRETAPESSTQTPYRHGDVVHLAMLTPDVERARRFYGEVLGWTYYPDGRVENAVPSVGFRATPGEATRTICDYAVDDLAVALDRLHELGGEAGEIERYPWGTVAQCVDDQGTALRLHELGTDGIAKPVAVDAAAETAYLSIEVLDSARARGFYGALVGWQFSAGRVDDGWRVDGPAPMSGLSGGHERATAVPMWPVPDIQAAVAAVRSHGGTATDPQQQSYATTSDCTDDQGLRFYLGQF